MLPEPGDFFSLMYHYVRPIENSKLRYIELQNFEKQLDYIEDSYGLVSKNDWENFREKGEIPRGALLTFDDGLKDHYKYVFPILRDRGIFAIFYVCTNPLQNLALPVHLTHYLLAHFDANVIWKELMTKGLPPEFEGRFDYKTRLAYETQNHSYLEKKLKRLVNWAAENIGQIELIQEVFTEFTGLSENRFIDMWYLNETQIFEIHNSGFEIGSHTCSHKLLSNLNEIEIESELFFSKNILKDICKSQIKSFCFPYGGKDSYTENVLDKLYQQGYTESFSVDPQPITNKFIRQSKRFELPRYDCNIFEI